jgi:parvulin-like peptidyl-prolyl isomerase
MVYVQVASLNRRRSSMRAACLLLLAALAAAPSRAEMVEEIIAWVNGDIITKSDLETEEQVALAEAYRQYTGSQLDEYVAQVRERLLMTLIDNKLLAQRARTIFNLSKMRDALWENFKSQQNIESDDEFRRMLAAQGFSEESFKDRLIEMYAPEEVLNFEVGGRTAVGDEEVSKYYAEHPDQFQLPAEATIREIVLLAEGRSAQNTRRAEAEEVLRRARGDDDFVALVKEVSEAGTGPSGGLLGPLKKGDLNEKLEELAFSLPVGAVSELIEMPYGFHIIKVEERTEERTLSLQEIRDKLEGALDEKKVFEARQEYLTKIRGEADWCVKEGYRDRLPITPPECREL